MALTQPQIADVLSLADACVSAMSEWNSFGRSDDGAPIGGTLGYFLERTALHVYLNSLAAPSDDALLLSAFKKFLGSRETESSYIDPEIGCFDGRADFTDDEIAAMNRYLAAPMTTEVE